MEYEKWTPTTYIFWTALMITAWVSNEFAVIMIAFGAFMLSLLWQLTQWIIIRRQRKAKTA